MKSKTKISKQAKKKFNPELVETIKLAKNSEKFLGVAHILSSPRRKQINLNLSDIDTKTKENDVVVVPGKVLSQGEMTKKIKIVAFSFSEKAREKLLNAKCDISTISEEIRSNKLKDFKLLK